MYDVKNVKLSKHNSDEYLLPLQLDMRMHYGGKDSRVKAYY